MAQEPLTSANAAARVVSGDTNLAEKRIFREGTSQRLSMTTTSAMSTALSIGTRAVRLTATGACYYAHGSAPTATNASHYLPAGVDREVAVTGGQKIAARTVTSTGDLHITELKV